jgi:hypothetical protein
MGVFGCMRPLKENDNETFRKSQDAWTISFSQYRNGDERIVKNGKKV